MAQQELFHQIVMITAGLGLFLHGLAYGSRALREGLGDGARRFFSRLGDRRGLSFLLGMLLSLLTQSSTAATSMAVGLVDVGLLPLTGAVVAMMGASMGTTLVILVLSLDVVRLSPFLLIGAVLTARLGNRKWLQPLRVLAGFSLVLVGMLFLGEGVRFLSDFPALNGLILTAANRPLLVALLSFAITSLVQSNVPLLALAIALASAGSLPLETALPVVVGGHVGSSTTVLVSGFGARVHARTLARAAFLYKLAGALLVTPLAGPILRMAAALGGTPGQQVAWMQIFVTTANALVLFPLAGPLTDLSGKISRSGAPGRDVGDPLYLDVSAASLPPLALSLFSREMVRLAGFLEELVFRCLSGRADDTSDLEKRADDLRGLARACLDYLSLIPAPAASSALAREYASLSYSMAALRDLVLTTSGRMNSLRRVGERLGNRHDDQWADLTESLKELMRESLGSLAVGGSDLASRAGEQYDRYVKAEKQIRDHLLSDRNLKSSRAFQEAWDFLSTTGSLARSCLELTQGDFLSRRDDWASPEADERM